MKIIEGKYSKAKVYTDIVEDEAREQIETLCSQEFTKGLKIRVMPDVHAGSGSTIGTTMTITDKVVPNFVGVDIGCGMETIRLGNSHIDLQKLDKLIYDKIPSGFNARKNPHKYIDEIDLGRLRCKSKGKLNLDRAALSMGTLGGGNHFIEADRDEEGRIYIVIHSGSRHLGLEVAGYYQHEAFKRINKPKEEELQNLIDEYKKAGKQSEIQKAMMELEIQSKTDIPKGMAYLEGSLMDDYIHDMKLIQNYARLNRKAMMYEIVKGMNLKVEEEFTTIHNYIDTDSMILRKGAVSAKKGETLIIPINMRDGSLICTGKGNEDWNYSAPHGAGRLMSRTQAKNTYTVSEYKKQMEGVYTTSVNPNTLDECPMAYKGIGEIVDNIGETAEITRRLLPIYNFKAGT